MLITVQKIHPLGREADTVAMLSTAGPILCWLPWSSARICQVKRGIMLVHPHYKTRWKPHDRASEP